MCKIVLFTNIKGGVGKTSCCALFAQYLCENGYSVKVLDADIQASLSRHRERELAANPDAVIPWEVSTVDTTDRQSLQSSIEEAMQFDGVVLFDMPGTLNAANLDLLYKAADLAVVPISYDFDTIDATGIFMREGHPTCIHAQPNQHDREPCRRDEAARGNGKNSWQDRQGHTEDQAECSHQALFNRFST